MTGQITLVGAGELMSAMSGLHRAALSRLRGSPRPVFLDTTAGFETNIDAIVSKAVEYYAHHLQTELRVARFRHREAPATEVAAAVAEVRAANLIFAGPGSPTYAIKQWNESPVWDAVIQQFEAGADLFFASAASISLGRHALPVYEIYKAGEDPFWTDGMDVLGRLGLNLAVVPHYDDSSGGDNYDSRFCYMGARRFDMLQACLPPDVAILGIDAYTAITLDPSTREAVVSGQGGITLIGDGAERRFEAGSTVPFTAFHSSSREVLVHEVAHTFGYAGAEDVAEADEDPLNAMEAYIDAASVGQEEKVELLALLQAARRRMATAPGEHEGHLVDLVLELRQALRSAKSFEMADRARSALEDLGFEVGDTPQGVTWSRR